MNQYIKTFFECGEISPSEHDVMQQAYLAISTIMQGVNPELSDIARSVLKSVLKDVVNDLRVIDG